MKRILSIIFVLLMVVLVTASCTPSNQIDSTHNTESSVIDSNTDVGTDTDTSLPSDTNTDSDNDIIDTGSDNLDSDIPTDADTDSDSDVNTDSDSNIDTDSDVNVDDSDDDGEDDGEDGGNDEKPEIIDITVSKTATEMADSIGKYANGDIVSGSQIKLDNNIYVSFGKGTANTEPALYSDAIRIYQNGGTLTVKSVNGCVLKTVIITFSDGKNGNGKLTVTGGSTPILNGDTLSINASSGSTQITVTVSGSTKTDRLYVDDIEVIYVGEGDDNTPSTPDNPSTGGGNNGYTYNAFTSSEKNTYLEYVGLVIPFFPNNDYEIEAYNEYGYSGVYFSAICDSEASFNSYFALFSAYKNDGTDVDDYGDTWYLFSTGEIYIDVCYYEYEGLYYVDVDAYTESTNQGGSGSGSGDGGNGGNDDEIQDGEHLYYDFTDEEKDIYNQCVDLVIPFLPTNDYYVESYDEYGYVGVYYSALCDTSTAFTWYLAMFSSYGYDGTEVDEYGDTWYLYSKNDIYIDVCYYEYEGAYYVDVDAYYEEGGSSGGGNGGSGDIVTEENVITNEGAGLPDDDGDGIYDIDFTDAEIVKDVTDQGYYLDGCPTTGAPGVLVIPVDFSDRTASSLGYSIENIKNAFEQNGQNDYYSVYDYYFISSLGQLTLDITVVDSWFRPSMPSTYYANKTMNYGGSNVLIGDQMIMDEALAYLSTIMDLSAYDSDKNDIIDAVVLVTTLEIDSENVFYWAYRYWNIYTDSDDYYYEYDGVRANDYLWAPYQFMFEDMELNGDYSDTSNMNTYTFIHEFGHVLGIDDYYDTSYVGSPLDGHDIMDSMIGDHNAYTKFNLGWITSSRLVVTDTSVTLTLDAFEKNGDTIIIANNFDPSLGVYQEYYILVYYTNDLLNAGAGGYFEESGILVYHVNASLYYEEYKGEEYEVEIYYDVYNTNTDASDDYGTVNNLIELVSNGNGYIFDVGDSLSSQTDDLGNTLIYTFVVDSLSDTEATITISVK